MDSDSLKPGDIVIELARLARTCSTVAGGIASAASAWITLHSILYMVIAVVVGSISGYLIGAPIGSRIFFASRGWVIVVKKGKQSLPMTFRASLPPALVSALVCSTAIGLLTNSADIVVLVPMAMTVGVVAGAILACLSSLT